MKRTLLKSTIALILLVCAASPAAADWMGLTTGAGQVMVCRISTPATASGAAVSGSAAFYGLIVITDGTNDVTVTVYDNTAASGTLLMPTSFVIPGTAKIWTLSYNPAIKCNTGIYVLLSVAGGGSATYQVVYDK